MIHLFVMLANVVVFMIELNINEGKILPAEEIVSHLNHKELNKSIQSKIHEYLK